MANFTHDNSLIYSYDGYSLIGINLPYYFLSVSHTSEVMPVYHNSHGKVSLRIPPLLNVKMPTSNVRTDFLMSLYLNFDKFVIGNKYFRDTDTLKTSANSKGLYHVMMVERKDGSSYYATKKVLPGAFNATFEVPIDAARVITVASSNILFSTLSDTGKLEQEFVPETSASGARATILSSDLKTKPGGFLATVVTDYPSYIYAFVRSSATREIIKVIRSKINTTDHKIYIKIGPGDYVIEYAAFRG